MQKESSSSVRIFYPKFDKEELIQKIKKKIGELVKKLPLSLVVLFGSYAQENNTWLSKVNFGIYNNPPFIFFFHRLEPHLYSEDEYERLRGIIDRMIADGVVLFSSKEAETT